MSRIMAGDEILRSLNSLNYKQRTVFSVVHNWTKEYVKHKGVNIKPVNIFLSRSGGTGKSHLVKLIYNAVSKTFIFNYIVFSLRPTGISEINIGMTKIHSALWIKPGAKLSGLIDKAKASLRNKLSEAKLLIIYEISIISSDLWTKIDATMFEIFSVSTKLSYDVLSLVIISDYLQLPPVRKVFIFSKFASENKMNQLLSLQLWYLFKYAELTEVPRKSDQTFANVLNNVLLSIEDENIERLLKVKFIDQSDKSYPHVNMYTKMHQDYKLGGSWNYMPPILVPSSAKHIATQVPVIAKWKKFFFFLRGFLFVMSSVPTRNYRFKVSNWNTRKE